MGETEARERLARVERAAAERRDEGRAAAVAKQHARGRLTVRERITRLFDPASFREFGTLVAPARDTEENRAVDAPADGVVTGSGLIDGRPAVVVGQDFTVLGGSSGRVGGEKTRRAGELAIRHGWPLVFLLEGGGHRIQDGQDARHFAHATPFFQQLCTLSGWAPIVAGVFGPGFAGPTNYAGLADFVVMVRGQATMGLAGPALVKAGTGEEIDAEALGGAEVQVDRYGLADLGVDSEDEAIAAIRGFLSYLPSNARAAPPLTATTAAPSTAAEELLDLVPANTRQSYDVRRVIRLLVDPGSLFEIKPTFARNLVTGFARLGGRAVGFIANQPQRLGGMIDAAACDKGAHFIAVCDAFGLPLIYLVDVPGFSIGSAAEKTVLGRRSAKLLHELGQATVPRVSIILRKGYGLGYFAMCGGRSFGADAVWAWPTAEICAMSVEGAIDVAYRKEYLAAPDPEARRAELIDETRQRLHAIRAAEGFGVDEVIDPRSTRARLIELLGNAQPRRHPGGPPKFRPIAPI